MKTTIETLKVFEEKKKKRCVMKKKVCLLQKKKIGKNMAMRFESTKQDISTRSPSFHSILSDFFKKTIISHSHHLFFLKTTLLYSFFFLKKKKKKQKSFDLSSLVPQLNLSTDYFLQVPPEIDSFDFDLVENVSIAKEIIQVYPNVDSFRYRMVPTRFVFCYNIVLNNN
mgnify:CR=1 FL=1